VIAEGNHGMNKLSTALQQFFFETEHSNSITLGEVLKLSEERVFGVLFVLLALPCALPIPHFGFSIPFSCVIGVLAVQLIMGVKLPWLPRQLLGYSVELKKAQAIMEVGVTWLQGLESMAKPRLTLVCTSLAGRTLIGLVVLVSAVFMALPVPGTNVPPAIGVLITGIGVLEDDGITTLIGLGVCILAAGLATLIVSALIMGGSGVLSGFRT
jgi:hypothetical protein